MRISDLILKCQLAFPQVLKNGFYIRLGEYARPTYFKSFDDFIKEDFDNYYGNKLVDYYRIISDSPNSLYVRAK